MSQFSSQQASIDPNVPSVFSANGQIVTYCGVGLCDALLQNSINAPMGFLYTKGLFVFNLVATQKGNGVLLAANSDGCNLGSPAGSSIELLSVGVGQPIPVSNGTAWFLQTTSSSSLLSNGAVAPRGFNWLIFGVAVEVTLPYQRGGTGAAASDPKFFSSWLGPQPNGPAYAQKLQSAVIENGAVECKFNDAGQSYRFGLISQHPSLGGATGGGLAKNGSTSSGPTYTPLQIAMCFGADNDVRSARITCTLGEAITIQNDASTDTISGSTAATALTINVANNGDVYIETCFTFFGRQICVPQDAFCGVPQASAARLGG